MIGGLTVSSAYTLTNNETAETNGRAITTVEHNDENTKKLARLKSDDFDKAFIEEMIAHHEGAIEMAKLTQTNSKHEELKTLGDDIMAAQSREIDMMQTWQVDWGYKIVPKSHNSH
jgi:uncharacterized protein (DUF305 family)